MEQQQHIPLGGLLTDDVSDFGTMPGFENHHSTEAKRGALPMGQNSPQKPNFGLYAEQLSGTAFTMPRATNRRSWLYRMRPSILHYTGGRDYADHGSDQVFLPHFKTAPYDTGRHMPAWPLRWPAAEMPEGSYDFVDGIRSMTLAGDSHTQTGMAAHIFMATKSMGNRYFMNADGEMLILPEQNSIRVLTEMGVLVAKAGEIIVIPRGVKFKVDLVDGPIRGYICENYGAILTIPDRGPIGANALANERDFLFPVAAYEDKDGTDCEYVVKWQGQFSLTQLSHSPLDVVAWHGNYAPYKYDLRLFNTIGSISFDHPDPSIFTVLTSASEIHGTANCDFVIFPDRWLVAENTFRPPWYHNNVMSEFMGLVYGVYDAKPGGFVPGGMSLHNAMLPHGPDAEAFQGASNANLGPQKLEGTMAFMFETKFVQHPTEFAATPGWADMSYAKCWGDLKRHFEG